MTRDLTAGEFSAATGLSPKALRLYASRRILEPASVDPTTGYRGYDRGQVAHGMVVDLLRRARVPLDQLGAASHFDFAGWREFLAVRRAVEDYQLEVAEDVAAFSPDEYVARSSEAAPTSWLGVVIDLGVPDDPEEATEVFDALAVDTPGIEEALLCEIDRLGDGSQGAVWTMNPGTREENRRARGQMLLARSTDLPADAATLRAVERAVRRDCGHTVAARTGTLPSRLEVTFDRPGRSDEPSLVDLGAEGYRLALAFDHFLTTHGLVEATPARKLSDRPRLFDEDAAVTTVFAAAL